MKKVTIFNHENDGIILHSNKIITINSKAVTIHTQTGALLTSITSNLSEGEPIGMDVTSNYLTVFTMEGYLKIFVLSEPQHKLLTPTKAMHDLVGDFGEIIQAKTNASGTKIALIIASINLIPDGKLYIYDIENNEISFKNFRNSEKVKDDEEQDDMQDDMKADKKEICRNRIPIDIFWDRNDPRLLICDAKKLKCGETKRKQLVRSKSNSGEFFNYKLSYSAFFLRDRDLVIVSELVALKSRLKRCKNFNYIDHVLLKTRTEYFYYTIPFVLTINVLDHYTTILKI